MLKPADPRSVATKMFSIEAMVRGYHVYLDHWDAGTGEQLPCKREPGNRKDLFTVAVVRLNVTIGHVCSMFVLRGGTTHI